MVRAHAGPLLENEALTIYVSAFLFFNDQLFDHFLIFKKGLYFYVGLEC